jgi:hypothetical protein
LGTGVIKIFGKIGTIELDFFDYLMPNPVSFHTNLVSTLVEYLTQETAAIAPELTWGAFEFNTANTDTLLGSVYIPSWTVLDQISADYYSCEFDIAIAISISKANAKDCIEAAHAWGGYLCETVIRKLRYGGHNGLFKGIAIATPCGLQEPVVNQDGGASTAVVVNCKWTCQECHFVPC